MYHSTSLAQSPNAHPGEAWVAFAYHVHWKYVESSTVPPQTLLDFRDHPSLVVDRLDASASWVDVEREVCGFEANTDGRPALRVPGRVAVSSAEAAVVIVANSERERDDWVTALRVRIAPWQVLARRATELVRSRGRGQC